MSAFGRVLCRVRIESQALRLLESVALQAVGAQQVVAVQHVHAVVITDAQALLV